MTLSKLFTAALFLILGMLLMSFNTHIALAAHDGGNYFCKNRDATHPIAQRITETYGASYEEVMSWFCKDETVGFGQDGEQVAELPGPPAVVDEAGRSDAVTYLVE